MYKVYENDKPAILIGGMFETWKNYEFTTFEESKNYAHKWLGEYDDEPPHEFKLNKRFYYNGVDYIIIKKD